MRVAINARFLSTPPREGLGQFAYEVCRRLVRDHPEHEFLLFLDRPRDPGFPLPATAAAHVLLPPAGHPLLTAWWLETALAPALRRHRADVLLALDGTLPFRTRVPGLPVVHDLAFEHFPEHLGLVKRRFWRTYVRASARRPDRVAAISEFTRRDLVATYGLTPGAIEVTPCGVDETLGPLPPEEQIEIRRRYSGGAEYYLHVGAIQPRKNVANLLRAFDRFKQRSGCESKLLFAGRLAWKYREVVRLHAAMRHRDDVRFLGYLPRTELARVLASARALACVSLYEGFALPVAEAMKCGVPVIGASAAAIPEVAGDAALLVDPRDPEAIAAALEELAVDPARRADLAARGRARVTRFDWNATAAGLWRMLVAASRGSFSPPPPPSPAL